jgi:hypothetical protein
MYNSSESVWALCAQNSTCPTPPFHESSHLTALLHVLTVRSTKNALTILLVFPKLRCLEKFFTSLIHVRHVGLIKVITLKKLNGKMASNVMLFKPIFLKIHFFFKLLVGTG